MAGWDTGVQTTVQQRNAKSSVATDHNENGRRNHEANCNYTGEPKPCQCHNGKLRQSYICMRNLQLPIVSHVRLNAVSLSPSKIAKAA
eukprot:scaffold148242_cov33-Prasinocladus_malaysianus.AAC.1